MWKDIYGWEGLYEISDSGEVRNKLNGHTRVLDTNSVGYKRITLYNKYHNPPTKRFLVHRLVANHFIPNPNNLPEVNHKDSNVVNNQSSNLEWIDRKDNELHSRICGSKEYKPFYVDFTSGERKVYNCQNDLAIELGVTKGCVTNWLIRNGHGYLNRGISNINYLKTAIYYD